MEESLAIQNIEAFCRLWSEEPDETRLQVLVEILGSSSGNEAAAKSSEASDRPQAS
ncbi:MAG: hypothetical protein AB7O56_08745 [Bauldia sp.]